MRLAVCTGLASLASSSKTHRGISSGWKIPSLGDLRDGRMRTARDLTGPASPNHRGQVNAKPCRVSRLQLASGESLQCTGLRSSFLLPMPASHPSIGTCMRRCSSAPPSPPPGGLPGAALPSSGSRTLFCCCARLRCNVRNLFTFALISGCPAQVL